ncbi:MULTISPECIES: serine/threonine protein kinase [unclassified Nostoc]|uniref:serine/threonine protein kinase n=1 Tax=unclassified Nostoc TaxID=2593658 RepID=UPI001D1CFFC9|nr:serine/threonine-protein kinase [Nostoc sp. JL23]MBN3880812.1 serine/threonine protein kinase [Nostoc sp. JL23]
MFDLGQTLQGQYQLQQQLGRTIAGRQTWLATDLATQTKELVILKLLVFSTELHWDDLKLFEREAQVLQNLNHPKIPRYRDYFLVEQQPGTSLSWWGLVQDYIPGSTLQELLEQGKRFSEQELRTITKEILLLLIYLHQLNPPVLHRDIKPSNLIQGQDQSIYLVDFGAVQDRTTVTGLTFTVVGTIGYTPMEQFWGRAVPASDLYALGATLIYLLTGVAPAELPQNNLRIRFRDRTNLSSKFGSWIEKLIQPDLEQRFADACTALKALEQEQELSSQMTRSKKNPGVYCIRPSIVVTKRSAEELEIHKFEEPVDYESQLIWIFFWFLLAGLPSIFGGIGISIFFWLLWVLFSSCSLPDLIARKISLLRGEKRGAFIRFDAKKRRFEFSSRWFRYSESGSDLIANIRSIYVSQYSDLVVIGSGNAIRIDGWHVIIRTDRRHRLHWHLNEEECAWLVNEIQTWLNHYWY